MFLQFIIILDELDSLYSLFNLVLIPDKRHP